MSSAAGRMLEWSTGFWQRYLEMLVQPGKAMEYAQLAAGATTEAVKLLTMSPEPQTRLRGKPGLSKRAAWCEPLPLAEVKRAGKVLGCSINDMLLATMKPDDWQTVIDTNLTGMYNFCQSVMRQMISQKCGRIINMSSVAAEFGSQGQVNYAASKGGIQGLTRCLAKEVGMSKFRR